ncbi:hypothetical protein [Billgrantia endophytica]|uniref:hypothetical protein n=1 Tax=Billgrantia endophytica TaxID=2033802 RepID=UPI00105687B1|nr:hypothetical protein [Halomonas endophytica]
MESVHASAPASTSSIELESAETAELTVKDSATSDSAKADFFIIPSFWSKAVNSFYRQELEELECPLRRELEAPYL